MKWSVLKQSLCPVTEEQFWTAIKIWRENTHVVNRRVSSIVEIHHEKLAVIQYDYIESIILKCPQLEKELIDISNVKQLIDVINEKKQPKVDLYLSIRKVLPRNSDQFHESIELVLQGKFIYEPTFEGALISIHHHAIF